MDPDVPTPRRKWLPRLVSVLLVLWLLLTVGFRILKWELSRPKEVTMTYGRRGFPECSSAKVPGFRTADDRVLDGSMGTGVCFELPDYQVEVTVLRVTDSRESLVSGMVFPVYKGRRHPGTIFSGCYPPNLDPLPSTPMEPEKLLLDQGSKKFVVWLAPPLEEERLKCGAATSGTITIRVQRSFDTFF